jgi:hypothetical protein
MGWEAISPEERHEGRGKGMQMLVESFQRAFAADGIPEKHCHKVNHVVVAKAAASKAHTLTDLGQDLLLLKMLGQQDDFAKPGWRTGH